MDHTQQTQDEQTRLWNGPGGRGWIELQETLDRGLQPFEDLLVQAVAAADASRVLDVGCGTGSTTLAVARLLGAQGRSIGIDLSAPMIAVARARAERERSSASFVIADAQTHTFEPASFEMIVSRFGVMFFDDSVRAFANLRRAAAPKADLRVVVWRSPADNPFMTAAERAAAPFLPELPARRPDEPGQFAFADRSRVHSILEKSGWTEIDIQPLDVVCTLPASKLDAYFTKLGPLGRVLQQVDEQERSRIIEAVRAAFGPYVHSAAVRFTAACWLVEAHA